LAIWGAAFKAGTASLENSVVHPLLQALWAQGCITQVYDPLASEALYANMAHILYYILLKQPKKRLNKPMLWYW
jgi:UDP-glucose 6-dehydrogenase